MAAGSRPSYDPTVLAPQPGSNPGYNPGYNQAPQPGPTPGYDPTILASSSGSGTPPPPTSYGADPYAPPPASSYASPSAGQYAPPPMGQYPPAPGPYGTPAPGAPYVPGAAPMPGPYVPPPAPKKGNRTLWTVLSIIAAVVVVGCAACGLITYYSGKSVVKNAQATSTAFSSTTNNSDTTPASDTTPTVSNPSNSTGNGSAPTSSDVDASAQAVITSVQMASAVNTQTGATTPATSFNSGQTAYVVFNLAKGSTGYFTSKWYIDGQLNHDGKVYPIDSTGEFYISLPISATGQGVVGVYYCTQASCSDAKLAQVATFTVQ